MILGDILDSYLIDGFPSDEMGHLTRSKIFGVRGSVIAVKRRQ